MMAVLFLAYFWETIEHYLEMGLAGGMVEYWFQGVEFWPNRLIADPAMLVIGYFIATKNPRLVVPARVLSLLWIIFHVFIFPHSMYLHELF
jgi:membrane protein YdbS with pleckstrin-like domain